MKRDKVNDLVQEELLRSAAHIWDTGEVRGRPEQPDSIEVWEGVGVHVRNAVDESFGYFEAGESALETVREFIDRAVDADCDPIVASVMRSVALEHQADVGTLVVPSVRQIREATLGKIKESVDAERKL